MDYINQAFARMNLYKVRTFLLHGTEGYAERTITYKDMLKAESDPIYNRLKSLYSDETEFEQATADLYQAMNAYEYVYMELGMKAGARLIHQLLLTDD